MRGGLNLADRHSEEFVSATAVPTLLKRINQAKKRRINLYDNVDCCKTIYATRYREGKKNVLCVTRIGGGIQTLCFVVTDLSWGFRRRHPFVIIYTVCSTSHLCNRVILCVISRPFIN